MKFNSAMEPLWQSSSLLRERDLPADLKEILTAGWLEGPAGSLVMRSLWGPGVGLDWSSQEIARHEYEVNDIWIPDSGVPVEREQFLRDLLSRARTFAYCAIAAARGARYSSSLVGVISIGVDDDYLMHGATVKFCTKRGGYPEFLKNLELFRVEAMAIIDSRELSDIY